MTIITARIRKSDGKLVRIHPDGREEILKKRPMRPMTEAEIETAGAADPAARPMTPEQLKAVRRVPRVRTLRRARGLTQEEFAARFHIPLGTLRDWQQGRTEPDQPARAYLRVIACDPEGVRRALQSSGASFTGMRGLGIQDCAIQESMGPIADRTLEHLGISDTAIVKVRRLLLQALKDHAAGRPIPGTDPKSYRVRSAPYKAPSGQSFADTIERHVRVDALVAAE